MSDSLSLSLDLRGLPVDIRNLVPLVVGTHQDQHGEQIHRGLRPVKHPSPFAKTHFQWIVRGEPLSPSDHTGVPCRIDADLNLPNALTGQNLVHGTSVFAAGIGGLMLLKTQLATLGIPLAYLQQLDETAVSLRGGTLTYLLPATSREAAQDIVRKICNTVDILYGARAVYFKSTNETIKYPLAGRKVIVTVYHKTDLSHCAFPDGAPVSELIQEGQCLVRIEVHLTGTYLREQGLTRLQAWKDAHSSGLYAHLFEEHVVKPLRLELRHREPRPDAYIGLSVQEREFLAFYLRGNDPRSFPSVLRAAQPGKTYSRLRLAVLALRIDTDIPWAKHQQLRAFELLDIVRYPGDYVPRPETAAWSFWKESWPQRLMGMEELCAQTAANCTLFGRP